MKLSIIGYILSQLAFWGFLSENKNVHQLNTIPQYFTLNDTIAPQKVKQEEVFINVKEPPKFPKGEEAMKSYIEQKAKYTKEAKKKRIEGRVIIQTIIEKDGSIGESKVLRGLGYGLDEVALEIVQNMPNWKPGYHDGKSVRVLATINIPFKF